MFVTTSVELSAGTRNASRVSASSELARLPRFVTWSPVRRRAAARLVEIAHVTQLYDAGWYLGPINYRAYVAEMCAAGRYRGPTSLRAYLEALFHRLRPS